MKVSRRAAESRTVLSEVMMPIHGNHYGNVHGGTILKLVDEAAFVVATKHARANVLLASMDNMLFKHQVNLGDMLIITASLCYVGRSSMEIEVDVMAEKIKEGKSLHIGSAYLTMVAVDEKGKPMQVPRLTLKTMREKSKSKHAITRRKKRLQRK